jgi:hypothetical protein
VPSSKAFNSSPPPTREAFSDTPVICALYVKML